MADRLSDGAVVAAIGADDHRGRGGLALAAKGAFVREDDMHPRRLDAAHHLDRAGEFALERPQARDVLHERRQPERAQLVVEFIADRAAARQTFFRQDHPRGGRLSGRRQNDGALGVDVERHARLAQGGADGGDVVAVEARIERLHRGPAEIIAGETRRHESGDADQRERRQTTGAQPHQVRPKPLDLRQQVLRQHPGLSEEFASRHRPKRSLRRHCVGGFGRSPQSRKR